MPGFVAGGSTAYLEHVPFESSGLTDVDLQTMRDKFKDHFPRSMKAFRVDSSLSLGRYGVIPFAYHPDKYTLLPQVNSLKISEGNMDTGNTKQK